MSAHCQADRHPARASATHFPLAPAHLPPLRPQHPAQALLAAERGPVCAAALSAKGIKTVDVIGIEAAVAVSAHEG